MSNARERAGKFEFLWNLFIHSDSLVLNERFMTIKDIINMSEFSEPYELMLIGRFVLLDLYFNLLNQKKTK